MKKISFEDLKNKRVHFIGIGGISMSGLAFMLMKNQIFVQGSDIAKNQETQKLENSGVKIFYGHKKENIEDANVVVYTSAIKDDNEELDIFEGEKVIKDNSDGVYKWFELSELEKIKIQPECSQQIIYKLDYQSVQHIINVS